MDVSGQLKRECLLTILTSGETIFSLSELQEFSQEMTRYVVAYNVTGRRLLLLTFALNTVLTMDSYSIEIMERSLIKLTKLIK